MSKTIITAKANSVFLATVLVAGVIALSYPSFMIGAQAQDFGMDQRYNNYEPEHETDYGMDSYDKKPYEKDYSYDKHKDSSSVNVKKVFCTNFNINGVEINALQPALNGLTSEAQTADEGEVGANSFGSGSGGSDGYGDGKSSGHGGDKDVICIFNNEEEKEPPTCDECFARLPENVQEALTTVLENIPPEGLPQPTTPVVTIPTTAGSIGELCDFLDDNILHVTPSQKQELISLFAQVEGSDTQIATDLIDCLIEAGIVDVLTR